MNKQQILRILESAGFKRDRAVPVSNDNAAETNFLAWPLESHVVRSAAIGTARHGLVWRGDVDINLERYRLKKVARQVGANLFVLDSDAASSARPGASKRLQWDALWWTRIFETDQDRFTSIKTYEAQLARRRRPRAPTTSPGISWVSKVSMWGGVSETSACSAENAKPEERKIVPVLYQRSGFHELIWFDNEQAVTTACYDNLRSKFGDLTFSIAPHQDPIQVRQQGEMIALLWPLQVPNPETASAARLEIALRQNPPNDHQRIVAIVLAQIVPALRTGGAELYEAATRLTDWLQNGPTQGSELHSMLGLTEWRKCREVELDTVFLFKGTKVPVDTLFQSLAQGESVTEFIASNPSVSANQVQGVLEYLWLSLTS